MKKTVLYCDRHNGEHPAVTTVWIRTVGMSRIMRVDVCEDAFRAIAGGVIAAQNGQPMLPAPGPRPILQRGIGRSGRPRGIGAMPGSDTAKIVTATQAFLKSQHERFTLDEVLHALNGLKLKEGAANLGRVMRAFVADGLITRHGTFGVFGPKGAPPPPKVTGPTELAQMVARCVRAKPGVRVAYLPGLLDLEPPVIKRTLKNLVGIGLLRTKGDRTASRAWPVEKK